MATRVTIPFRAAWDLREGGANLGRARVTVNLKRTTSQNLIGDIPGRRPDLPLVLIGAHHDTQCNNTGADDNASGVVALMELAPLLPQEQWLLTVLFISFGAEEQLSVASARLPSPHPNSINPFMY